MEDKSPMVGPGKAQKGYGAPSPSADNETARSHNSNVSGNGGDYYSTSDPNGVSGYLNGHEGNFGSEDQEQLLLQAASSSGVLNGQPTAYGSTKSSVSERNSAMVILGPRSSSQIQGSLKPHPSKVHVREVSSEPRSNPGALEAGSSFGQPGSAFTRNLSQIKGATKPEVSTPLSQPPNISKKPAWGTSFSSSNFQVPPSGLSGKGGSLQAEYSPFTLNPSVLGPMMSGKIIKRKENMNDPKAQGNRSPKTVAVRKDSSQSRTKEKLEYPSSQNEIKPPKIQEPLEDGEVKITQLKTQEQLLRQQYDSLLRYSRQKSGSDEDQKSDIKLNNKGKSKRKKGRPKKDLPLLPEVSDKSDDDEGDPTNAKRKRTSLTRDEKISREINTLIVIDAIEKEARNFEMGEKLLDFKRLSRLRIKRSILNYKECQRIWERFKSRLESHAKRNESFRFLRREIEEDIFANYHCNLNSRLDIYESLEERDSNRDEEESSAKNVLAQIFQGYEEQEENAPQSKQEEKQEFGERWEALKNKDLVNLKQQPWNVDELLSLLRGISNLGEGEWNLIRQDEELLGAKRSNRELALKWRELKTLMLNDLEDINQERISYKYNLQSQKNMLRNPRCTVLPSTFLQDPAFPNSLRRVTINKWEWLSAAIKKLENDSYISSQLGDHSYEHKRSMFGSDMHYFGYGGFGDQGLPSLRYSMSEGHIPFYHFGRPGRPHTSQVLKALTKDQMIQEGLWRRREEIIKESEREETMKTLKEKLDLVTNCFYQAERNETVPQAYKEIAEQLQDVYDTEGLQFILEEIFDIASKEEEAEKEAEITKPKKIKKIKKILNQTLENQGEKKKGRKKVKTEQDEDVETKGTSIKIKIDKQKV